METYLSFPKNRPVRILNLTDFHASLRSEFEEERWWPLGVKILPEEKARAFLDFWDKGTVACLKRTLKQAQKFGPYDLIVVNGDMTPGMSESGLINPKARREARVVVRMIKHYFPDTPIVFNPGNHDLGYGHLSALGNLFQASTTKGGISSRSVLAAEKIYNPLWQLINGELLFINSQLLHEKLLPPAVDAYKQAMINWLMKTLEIVQRVFLFIHDAEALAHIWPQIKPYHHKIVATFSGHYHSPFIYHLDLVWKFFRGVFGFDLEWYNMLLEIDRMYNVHIIPSTLRLNKKWPCFAILEIGGDKYRLRYVNCDGEISKPR